MFPRRSFTLSLALLGAMLAFPASAHDRDDRRDDDRHHHGGHGRDIPLVIGHRGASGYLPEHTLEAYALAIQQGADYIEPDLVITKDGHLIARHEPNLIATTDVKDRPEFASRRRVMVVDGFPEEGFFASDFTLKEIKTLRAVQAFAERPQQYNGKFRIPTFKEVIDLAKKARRDTGRVIGIAPETKHPTYHQQLGLALERPLVRALTEAGWNDRHAPVFIQSFEQGNLKQLNRMTHVRLIQLLDANDVKDDGTLDFTAPYDRPYDWTASGDPRLLSRTFAYLTTDAGLREVRQYADGISPWKRYIVGTTPIAGSTAPGEAARKLVPANDLIKRAHKLGLVVQTWTFRNEARRLPADYGNDPAKEYKQFYELGIDGVFSDFPDTAVKARKEWLRGQR
ncbi:glycerophosphodiester phosphodiesterase [Uliginosibacterium sp. H1]|uniref:glycerophosphodiester phosphodiesterase n=1 Tax=Uliginosibacterium sp. H1 TaxID=3114757 RepID=UPI002E17A815|nr:glycerophosphodiester phosphodiesterase [Uliginosibacterium sp. H1]